MVPSESSSSLRNFVDRLFVGGRVRVAALALLASILLWDTSAFAINAIVSQDLPVLTQIAATEMASYLELGAILVEAAAIVEQVKEYTTIAKTAWGALDELRTMSLEDLGAAALQGVGDAFPEVGEMYGNIRDIRDLDYRDYRAYSTLRGILWEEFYGPGIDYLHTAHSDLDAVTAMQEHQLRQRGKVEGRRKEAQAWEDDCKRTSKDGKEGACQGAAHRAAVQQALLLTDLNETSLFILDAQQREIQREDRRELDDIYSFERWAYDLENLLLASAGIEGRCRAGTCLYDKYGNKMMERVNQFRRRHPQRYEHKIGVPTEGGGR